MSEYELRSNSEGPQDKERMCKWLIHRATNMILYAVLKFDCCVKVKKDLHHDRWRVWRFVALITRGKH